MLKAMKIKPITLLFLAAFAVLVSCSRYPTPDGKKTREQFIAAAKTFPYSAPKQRQMQIIGNYPKIDEGMNKQQIAAFLGDPDYTDIIGNKTITGIKPTALVWVYAIYCQSQFCGTMSEEKLVSVFFDLDDKATWIVPSGLVELKEKGHPSSR